jgi:hypothetical protein
MIAACTLATLLIPCPLDVLDARFSYREPATATTSKYI